MHDTAFATGTNFLAEYAGVGSPVIVELGAYNYNGSLLGSCPPNATYIGLDVEHGPGVDIVIKPGQPLPLKDGFADFVVSTSQMEHDPKFWMTFLELCRITKEGGAIFLNAPSNGLYHSYPVDVWRFYPEAGKALADWAKDNNHNVVLWESFICARTADIWNDFVAVFHKGERRAGEQPGFIHSNFRCFNVWKFGEERVSELCAPSEDMMIIDRLRAEAQDSRDKLDAALTQIQTLEERLRHFEHVAAADTSQVA